MTLKFFSGLAILLLALFLQFFLASSGIAINLVLAVLIAFAFVFDDIWELLIFILFAIFVLNGEPAPSPLFAVFALIPLAAFAFQSVAKSERWIGSIAALLVGFLIFYLAASPSQFFAHPAMFFIDFVVGLIAAELVITALKKKEH